MSVIGYVHNKMVYGRRVRVLSESVARLLPAGSRVLDIGCGDGLIASLVMREQEGIEIEGIDVLVRAETHVPVRPFDGVTIPHEDGSFDAVMFVDVLHHTDNPMALLREAGRVARRVIVIKDHTREGLGAGTTLRFMDWVGNARHGVALPYNYWTAAQWRQAFAELGFQVDTWIRDLGLYPVPARWLFERSLHFLARLRVAK
jgi:SAM-dependent methyltransferase